MLAFAVFAAFALVVLASLAVAPRRASVAGFFGGLDPDGTPPGLWVLVFSQVTTWIFARSLMNAAILGYYYGIAGVVAYTAYYGSFLTGAMIVDRLRRDGRRSVQDWLGARFGRSGVVSYTVIVAMRLLSEVFANLLVVGLIASAVLPGLPGSGTGAIVLVAALALAYSAWGGLSAALRTDVVQMLVFLVVFGIAVVALVLSPGFDLGAVLTAPGTSGPRAGWVLLLVALLQVFSYPAHDPVMMDRGFLADPRTTRLSFLHAFWLSSLCIFAFGVFGIQAGLVGAAYENELIGTWGTIFPAPVFIALMVSLLISALSTLDSTLSSAARLMVEECGLPRSLTAGRVTMVGFLALGASLTLWGSATLFDAVAVSGTASMFLTPVLVAGLLQQRAVPLWSYLLAYAAAVLGALAFLFRSVPFVARILPDGPKYDQLLVICVAVLLVGFAAVTAGGWQRRRVAGES
ncbi:sodium:proline symporter [Pseudoruegeria sp. SK021]|uniref:sodium:proline symporter n=1 Tax=Pseudoruegeria sp. SK021 TaxID=1933035 RepID=UPI000A228363|nr:sodium:proline symporter [Pseudoruegeria sp. SK021]OSP54484.1 sodium:proline symporter [Pseudoruegeria sp. SK021]